MSRKSHGNCCVVGCGNTYATTGQNVRFYSFPSQPWEANRRSAWIQAIKRKNQDGTPWEPTKHSRVCSEHFVGGQKSDHPHHPCFVPSIFPKIYKKKVKKETDVSRHERYKKRQEQKAVDSATQEQNTEGSCSLIPDILEKFDKGVEVHLGLKEAPFMMICDTFGNEKGLQANIGLSELGWKPKTLDVSTQTDPVECKGFHGFEDVKNEEQCLDICGINLQIFSMMLANITFPTNATVSAENRCLLFLMKLKLGLTFSSLAVIFKIHRTTASKIFQKILLELSSKYQNFIFWPTKEAVQENMPPCFKLHYPNTRIIIDCTEVKTEQPPRIDQRNYFYSNYKGSYTVKFLLGITPNGQICFKSKCFGGRASDAYITNASGLAEMLEPGDIVLADKGFPGIQANMNSVVITPPFVHHGTLSLQEIEETYNIAAVRIHVERAIQRMKNFKILKSTIPVSLLPYIDEIVHIVCVLVNFSPPLIKDK